MDIFKTEISVAGSVVRGHIQGDTFHLNELNTTVGIVPPMKDVLFTKQRLQTTIHELQQVLDKLEEME